MMLGRSTDKYIYVCITKIFIVRVDAETTGNVYGCVCGLPMDKGVVLIRFNHRRDTDIHILLRSYIEEGVEAIILT